MKQPFEVISRIGEWCQSNEVDWALAGSWALLLNGVVLPRAPHDLDAMLGLIDLTQFYADNPWITQRAGESIGRSIIPEDLYTVDLLPTISDFQVATLSRARPIKLGSMTIKLVDPIDILLFKLGHEFFDDEGIDTCKAVIDWRYAQKPPKPTDCLNLSGGDNGYYWSGPVRVYNREE